MQKSIKVKGKTEEEAIASALKKLNLQRDEVSVELLERARTGFLGIGASPAVVKVTYEAPDEPAEEPADEPKQPPVKDAAKPKVETAPSTPVPASAPMTDAEFETKIRTFLEGLLERMGVKAEMTFSRKPDNSVLVELSGSGMGAIIGRRGETLDAIQHLTNYSVNRGAENRVHISIDAENYRSKREESLVRLAEKMAAKTIKYQRSMALEPMNSYERHVIHTALQDYPGVTTCSTGTEPNRRVVISIDKSSKV